MKTTLTLLFLCICYSAFPQWKVRIKAYNLTSEKATLNVETGQQGDITSTLFRKSINPSLSVPFDTTLKLPKYAVVKFSGLLEKGGSTNSVMKIVNEKNMTISYDIKIDPVNNSTPSSLTELVLTNKILEYNPKLFFNKNGGFGPASALFDQYLGGLQIIAKINGKDSLIDRIEPHELGVEMQISFPSNVDSKEFFIKNNTDQEIKAAFPGIVQIGVNFMLNTLYSIKTTYQGVGEVEWENQNNVSINENFVKMNSKTHYKLAMWRLKYADSNLRVVQINKGYCVQAIYYETTDMTVLKQSQVVDANSYAFNDGRYEYNKTNTHKRNIGSIYLGYWSDNGLDFTTLLDFSLNEYFKERIKAYAPMPNDAVVKDYQEKLRVLNSSLPDLKTKAEIMLYLKDINADYVNDNKIQSIQ